MSLNASELTPLTASTAVDKLFNEWLALYFDGASHPVGEESRVFPKVNRAFGQGAPAQPLHDFDAGTDAEIRLVVLPRGQDMELVGVGRKLITDRVQLQFWISAKAPGVGQSERLARQLGDLLAGLLENPDPRYLLAEKGVRSVTGVRRSPPMAGRDYHQRLVSCSADLQYLMAFTDPQAGLPLTTAPSVVFLNEFPLIEGEYLVGAYQWPTRTRLLSAQVYCWPPTGAPVVLGLEVGGAVVGTLTIPPGPENEDLTVSESFNLTVSPDLPVRWKVVSAPTPEFSAWHLTLMLLSQPQ